VIAVGAMTWRSLAFVHWAVPARTLRDHVPAALEIDTFAGEAFVGLIPFAIEAARPRLLPPLPGASSFPETNLRTYVRHGAEAGIWFFSLDAGSPLAVLGARALYALPYHRARMAVAEHDGEVDYRSDRAWPEPCPAALDATCSIGPAIGEAQPETLEEFLVERYVLFSHRGGALRRARVRHRPYPLHRAEVELRHESLRRAAELPELGVRIDDYYCPELRVEVSAPRRLDRPHARP
jgi:uncharacterized protein